jgi:hypothetical protein
MFKDYLKTEKTDINEADGNFVSADVVDKNGILKLEISGSKTLGRSLESYLVGYSEEDQNKLIKYFDKMKKKSDKDLQKAIKSFEKDLNAVIDTYLETLNSL